MTIMLQRAGMKAYSMAHCFKHYFYNIRVQPKTENNNWHNENDMQYTR